VSSVVTWLAICAAAGIAFILIELLARWWLHYQNVYYVWGPGFKRILWLDREALPSAEPCVHFEVNSIGERGPEPPPPNDTEPVYRVLAAGGSAVECMLLDQFTSWPGALHGILNRSENREALAVSRVHVGNLSKAGLDSRGLDVALRHALPNYRRLDAMVVMVGGSNVMNWLAAGTPAGAGAPPLPDSEIFHWQPNGPFSFRPKHTALAEIARRLRLRVLRPTELRHGAGKFMTRIRAMRKRAAIRDTLPDPTAMLDEYAASLRAALVTAMQHSERVILARQPWFDRSLCTPEEESHLWHGALGDPFAGEVKSFASSKAMCELMWQLDRRAIAVADELGLEHVDLPGVLEPNLSHYYDTLHFTAAGSVRVAEVIAASLLRNAGQGAVRSHRSSHRPASAGIAPSTLVAARSRSLGRITDRQSPTAIAASCEERAKT
jgi:lysophospholipase L1-like esterase